jgi:hypothetical protein
MKYIKDIRIKLNKEINMKYIKEYKDIDWEFDWEFDDEVDDEIKDGDDLVFIKQEGARLYRVGNKIYFHNTLNNKGTKFRNIKNVRHIDSVCVFDWASQTYKSECFDKI